MPRYERVDLRTMIFVIREALVNLCTRQVGETANNIVDAGAVYDQANDIMDSDAGAFDTGISATDTVRADDVAVRCGYVGHWLRV